MPPRSSTALVVWRENRGLNDWDIPTRLLPGQVTDAMNVMLERGTLGRKRYGSVLVTITGISTSSIYGMYCHVPHQDDTAAEIFFVVVPDEIGFPPLRIKRVAAGTTAVLLTMADPIDDSRSVLGTRIYFVSGNEKLFIFYPSNPGVNRGHVFDPKTSTTAIRRMGLATPAAPTVSATGGGVYPAVLRYYRVQWVTRVSGADYLRSNLGTASAPHTPPGISAGALVARPALPGESETHWALYGSADDLSYYLLADTIPIGTSTFLDTTLVTAYPLGDLAPEEGAFTPFPACKYGLYAGDRLLGFGVWEENPGDSHVPKDGTVYFSPPLDTTGPHFADDERCSNSITFKGSITISRNSGAEDRAIAGPLYDEVFCFQSRGVYALTPTGQAQKPYLRAVISTSLGAVSQASTFMGEDEFGRPCIYFLDPTRGPYRYSSRGMQWLGYDVQSTWATFSQNHPTEFPYVIQPAEGVYDADRRLVIWDLSTGATTVAARYAQTRIVFSVRDGVETPDGVRYGWTRETVPPGISGSAAKMCLAMLPTIIGAPMSRQRSPYIGGTFNTSLAGVRLFKQNVATATDDHGTAYQGSLTSPVFDANAPQYVKAVAHAQGFLLAKATQGVEVQVAITQNYGDRPVTTHQVSLSPRAVGQTRITARIDGIEAQELSVLQVTMGDRAAVAVTPWTLDEFGVELEITDQMVRNP